MGRDSSPTTTTASKRKKSSHSDRDRHHHDKDSSDRKRSRKSSSSSHSHSKGSRHPDSASEDEGGDREDYSGYATARRGKPVIGRDDYFAKATEFQTWLRIDKKRYFNDLSGDDARSYFDKFAKRWNRGKLERRYYDGIATSDVPASERTRHQWKFKNLDEGEMTAAQDSVHAMTQSSIHLARPMTREEIKRGPQLRNPLDQDAELDRREKDRLARRLDNKKARAHHEMVLEELVPKATGREAQLEKKRAGNQNRHDRQDHDFEMPDADLMGSGPSGPSGEPASLAAYKQGQERRNERRNVVQGEKALAMAGKVAAYQAKEDQTLAMFRQMAQNRFGGGGA
ncbi:hypothetical protein HKX48_001065 [Thoreauomyces humboldtii]|nr:hypothetical protein HKX48_001065 [Thoreauomyces humboldtii]